MAGQQTLAQDLIAAGTTLVPKEELKYQLVVDPAESSLSLQTWSWNGDNLRREELVVGSVRANSTASLLLSSSGKIIICITASSKLAAYTYDEDESEWVESKGHPVSRYTVHADGKLSSITSPTGRTFVVFQDQSGRIVSLDNDWKLSSIPVDAISGTPFSIAGSQSLLQLFYISSKDNFIHAASRKPQGEWQDEVAIKYTFEDAVRAFFMSDGESYILTSKNSVFKVTVDGKKSPLGTVKGGKFVPRTTEENVTNIYYIINYGNWQQQIQQVSVGGGGGGRPGAGYPSGSGSLSPWADTSSQSGGWW